MTKIKNSFKNIITVLLALLVLGLTARTAGTAITNRLTGSVCGGTLKEVKGTLF